MTKTRKNNKPIKGGNMGPVHSLIKYMIKFALKNLNDVGLYSESLSDYILEDSVITNRMGKIFNNKGLNRVKMIPPSIFNQLPIEIVDDLAGHFEDDKISPFPSSPHTMNSDSM